MCDNIHVFRSMNERLKFENDNNIEYDKYAQRIIDDQEMYDNENDAYTIDSKVNIIYVK